MCFSQGKSCEEIVSTLRNGLAAENAVALMQEKGLSLQRKSRHRLTPGTVKYAAYHVLAFEGSKGLNVTEIAEKIQVSIHWNVVSYLLFNSLISFLCIEIRAS